MRGGERLRRTVRVSRGVFLCSSCVEGRHCAISAQYESVQYVEWRAVAVSAAKTRNARFSSNTDAVIELPPRTPTHCGRARESARQIRDNEGQASQRAIW